LSLINPLQKTSVKSLLKAPIRPFWTKKVSFGIEERIKLKELSTT
jgi:hypothetical protein